MQKILLCLILTYVSPALFANNIDIIKYLSALTLIKKKQFKAYRAVRPALKQHLLYPYLQYYYLKSNHKNVADKAYLEHIKQYSDIPNTWLLQKSRLYYLGEQRLWNRYKKFYYRNFEQYTDLYCFYLRAVYHTQKKKSSLTKALDVWLVGKSQPKACDPLFSMLYKKNLISAKLRWQRIELALERGNISLATFLVKPLPKKKRDRVALWLKVKQNPAEVKQLPKHKAYHNLAIYGVKRLARKDPERANTLVSKLKNEHRFSKKQYQSIQKKIALSAAYKHLPSAYTLLSNLPFKDNTVKQWRIRTALRENSPKKILMAIEALPKQLILEPVWQYWKAMALQQLGKKPDAKILFLKLAKGTNFYAFLAADKVNQAYQFNHISLKHNKKSKQQLSQKARFKRAKMLYEAQQLSDARREWRELLPLLNTDEKQSAALLAHQWGWHYQAIISAASAQLFNDLKVRFPTRYKNHVQQCATEKKIDPNWIFAVIRTESAFMPDISSSAGAIGLMQLMPTTAKMIARKEKIRLRHKLQLLNAQTNIQIGCTYLKRLATRFNHLVYATAAYNAGPTRVKRWQNDDLAKDVWIETIPFDETRKYVKRVLYYHLIYQYRLQNGNNKLAAMIE